MSSENHPTGPDRGHPESTNPKERVAASETLKDDLYKRALAIANSGHPRPHGTRTDYHEHTKVPDTVADTLAVVAYGRPVKKLGSEGVVLLITHKEAIGTPDVRVDESGRHEFYSTDTTHYLFLRTPDGLKTEKTTRRLPKPSERPSSPTSHGLHIERATRQSPEPSEQPSSPTSRGAEEWEIAVAALLREEQEEAEFAAYERAAGLRFFSQQDAKNLEVLMEQVWPQAGGNAATDSTN